MASCSVQWQSPCSPWHGVCQARLSGSPLPKAQREQALELARACIDAHPIHASAGATSPDAQVIVVRVLAPVVEPAMQLLRQVRGAWRQHFWQLAPTLPRIWSM